MSTIQITKSGTVFSGDENTLQQLSKEYENNHWIKLPNFLEPGLLQFIQSRIEQADFQEKCYADLGTDSRELRLSDEIAVSTLEFLLNDGKLFKLMEKVTGCPEIGCFAGRVYRLSPNVGMYDAWHDDDVYNRMVSISINLSTEKYSGGILQIKNADSNEIIQEVSNTGFGDCVIFKVSPELMHRVSAVEGATHRTAFAGWFHSAPVYAPIFNPMSGEEIFNSIDKPKISRHSTVSIAGNLLSHGSSDQLLVFNPENTVCYGLDQLGAKILNMLEKPMPVNDIKNILLKEYNVPADKCESDLIELIQRLETNGMIAVHEKESLALK